MENQLLQTSLLGESTKLTADELKEVIGYAKHLRQVREIVAPKEMAMLEIRQALKIGYSF